MKYGSKSKYAPTTKKNCSTCLNRIKCKDPKKKKGYRCTRFSSKLKTPDKIESKTKLPSQFMSLVKSSLNTEFPVVGDLRIDDRDLPKAKNFVDYSRNYAQISPDPYAKQVETAINAYAEWCPRCSKPEYALKIPVDHTLDQILDNIQLLENGICPKCGVTRSELFRKKELNANYEIAGLAGQRCVVGNTLVLTEFGYHPIIKLCNPDILGFSVPKHPFMVELEDGLLYNVTRVYTSKPSETIKVFFETTFIEGTPDHPILSTDGKWILLKDVQVGHQFKRISFEDESFKTGCEAVIRIEHNLEKTITFDFEVPNENRFISNGIISHNTGKSSQISMFGSYSTHMFMKLPNPPKVFSLLDNSMLRGTFVALDLNQAKETWDPYLGYVQNGQWFVQYHEMLDYYQKKLGEEIYKIKDTFIEYKHKRIHMKVSPPNKRALRGSTRFWGVVDEIGWFDANKSDSIKYDADEIYKSLGNSFRTIRSAWLRMLKEGYNDLPPPMFCNISSPSSPFDKIVRLVKQSKHNPNMHGFWYATWEANPTMSREDLKAEFDADPVLALRDFGAVPPMSSSPFISDRDSVEKQIDKTKINCFRYETISVGIRQSIKLSFNWTENSTPKILAIDAGKSNNSFSLCLAHKVLGKEEYVVDGLIEIIPTEGRTIDYSDVFDNVILKIIKQMRAVVLATDGWQNLKILHDAEKQTKIEAVESRLKYSAFTGAKELILSGKVKCPRCEMKYTDLEKAGEVQYPMGFQYKPVAHYIFQVLTVQDSGKTVDKGQKTTDDTFRTVIMALRFLTDPAYSKKLEGRMGAVSSGALGAIGGLGTSGGNSVTGVGGIGIAAKADSTGSSGGGMGSFNSRGQ